MIFAVLGIIAANRIGTRDVQTACTEPHSPLAQYISIQEGWGSADTLVRRLNNPGALVCRSGDGADCSSYGFAHFAGPDLGWAALEADLAYKRRHHIPLSVGWTYLPN